MSNIKNTGIIRLICNATFFRDAILGIIYREKWLYPA